MKKNTKQTDLPGHILRSIIVPKSDKLATFTTEPKKPKHTTIDISRKGSIIKEKCRQLTEIALELFPVRRIPDEDLAYLIRRYIGGDRETVRAYMGYKGTVKRSKRTGEGYVAGNSRKGYLETFDFMHKVSLNEWVIHAQMKLQNADSEHHNHEGLSENVSKEKISLSERGKATATGEGLGHGEVAVESREINNNNNNTVRERNFTPKIYSKDFGNPQQLQKQQTEET